MCGKGGGDCPKFPGIFLEISSIFQTFCGFVTPLSPVQLPVPFTHAALWGWCRQEPNLGLFYCKKKREKEKEFSEQEQIWRPWEGLVGWGGGEVFHSWNLKRNKLSFCCS